MSPKSRCCGNVAACFEFVSQLLSNRPARAAVIPPGAAPADCC